MDKGRIGKAGETRGDVRACCVDAFIGHAPVLRVGINLGPVPVERELEALPVQFRQAVRPGRRR
jgi:hypothetical protein